LLEDTSLKTEEFQMPAIVGVIERLHQPLYDTMCRGVVTATVNIGAGNQPVTTQTRLFSGNNLGNKAWTNMRIAGQLVADRTFKIKALRVWTYFRAGLTTVSPSYRVHRLYLQCQAQLFWTLSVGDKPQFTAGTHYIPMAAGIYGDIGGDTDLVLINNGYPSHSALLRLGRPILIPPRQGIDVLAEIFQMAAGDHDLVTSLNLVDDIGKDVKYFVDGLGTREVQ
jgi:hypothetical protein